ncbi:MAG: hypothetical protein HYY52_03710 [Candidatus Melainabacteria bacterium]|nr:hypothetical protein [Candidatus Melainabacteria bacterium]
MPLTIQRNINQRSQQSQRSQATRQLKSAAKKSSSDEKILNGVKIASGVAAALAGGGAFWFLKDFGADSDSIFGYIKKSLKWILLSSGLVGGGIIAFGFKKDGALLVENKQLRQTSSQPSLPLNEEEKEEYAHNLIQELYGENRVSEGAQRNKIFQDLYDLLTKTRDKNISLNISKIILSSLDRVSIQTDQDVNEFRKLLGLMKDIKKHVFDSGLSFKLNNSIHIIEEKIKKRLESDYEGIETSIILIQDDSKEPEARAEEILLLKTKYQQTENPLIHSELISCLGKLRGTPCGVTLADTLMDIDPGAVYKEFMRDRL